MRKSRLATAPLVLCFAIIYTVTPSLYSSAQEVDGPAKGVKDKPVLVSLTVTPKLLERAASNTLKLKISFKDDGKNLRGGSLELRIDDSAGKSQDVILNLKRKKFSRKQGKHRFTIEVSVGDVDWIRISGWLRDSGGKASTPKRVKIPVAAADDDDPPPPPPPPPWGTEIGNRAVDFTLIDQHGNEVSLHDYWGSVILLDFSTMWCGPCQDMANDSEQLYQTNKNRGFIILSVLVEDYGGQQPTQSDCQNWAEQWGISTPVMADVNRQTFGRFRDIFAYPLLIIIDREMVIREKIPGYGKTYIEMLIEQYLSETTQVSYDE